LTIFLVIFFEVSIKSTLGARIEKSSLIQRFKTFGDTIVGLAQFFSRDPSDSYDPLPAHSAGAISSEVGTAELKYDESRLE
jgi:hypothetical protein